MTPRPDDEPTDGGPAERLTVLTFTLLEERYCVRLEAVDAVVGVTETDPLEDAADPWNAGAVTVDGTAVRVVDLRGVFAPTGGRSSRVEHPALLVLSPAVGGSVRYGWLVDDVGVTASVDPAAISRARTSARVVRGRIDLDGGAATLLDDRAMHD